MLPFVGKEGKAEHCGKSGYENLIPCKKNPQKEWHMLAYVIFFL
jgi:hypothetical protein